MEKSKIRLGLIAGTQIDTKFGIDIFRRCGFDVFGKHLFDNLIEQTKIEILNPDKLTKMVLDAAKEIETKVDAIVIYCNTLASAVDVERIRNSMHMAVVVPHDIYKLVAKEHNIIGLIAMSGVSVSKIEKVITSANPDSIVLSYANPEIANDVEKEVEPSIIIESRGVLDFVKILEKNNAGVLILGCTHFPYFHAELKKKTSMAIVEPSEGMRDLIFAQMKKLK